MKSGRRLSTSWFISGVVGAHLIHTPSLSACLCAGSTAPRVTTDKENMQVSHTHASVTMGLCRCTCLCLRESVCVGPPTREQL